MKKYDFTQDELNAFIDGDIDNQLKEKILSGLDENQSLQNDLCEIYRLKKMLQFSYPEKTLNDRAASNQSVFTPIMKTLYMKVAASFLLVLSLGFVGGYGISSYFSHGSLDDGSSRQLISQQHTTQAKRVILYLGSSEEKKMNTTLNKIDSLMTGDKKNTEVIVVTSAGGIDLLRDNNKQRNKRINVLLKKHKSLKFVACNNQIYYLKKKGHAVNLVDSVEVAPSAVQFVVEHIKKGWTYIAI